jgi:hypothetical protein
MFKYDDTPKGQSKDFNSLVWVNLQMAYILWRKNGIKIYIGRTDTDTGEFQFDSLSKAPKVTSDLFEIFKQAVIDGRNEFTGCFIEYKAYTEQYYFTSRDFLEICITSSKTAIRMHLLEHTTKYKSIREYYDYE